MSKIFYYFSLYIIGTTISLFILFGCSQKKHSYMKTLNAQQPFGLKWERTKFSSKNIERECLDQIQFVQSFLSSTEIKPILKDCISKSFDTVYLPNKKLSQPFKNGGISAVINGSSDPIMYTYSYLHELHPTKVTLKKKRLHAADLESALNKLYGLPVLHGFFNENSKLGFVVSNERENPCAFWLTNNVGIFLCSERVIFLDGFEMSLSFIRQDNSAYGNEFQRMILSHLDETKPIVSMVEKDVKKGDETSIDKSLNILKDWLDRSSSNCKSEFLKPLEEVWRLSNDAKSKLNPVLQEYSGESLASYAIEYASNSPNNVSKQKLHKITMYLFKKASDQGSTTAMNEIGASLFYCYQDVQQNKAQAYLWIDKAIKGGDLLAIKTRAAQHLNDGPDIIKSRKEAIKLLKRCNIIDANMCHKELLALQTITGLVKISD